MGKGAIDGLVCARERGAWLRFWGGRGVGGRGDRL